ncbi:hypothetical protein, partial [Okeania sp. SIO2F5]|uniref:hypothetical protein n=1 Tax=Okeania sp. SIO2F5 TaxID=2607794 RepID=UPI002580D5BE
QIHYSVIAYIAEGRRRLVVYNRRKEENQALSEFSAFDMSNTLISWKNLSSPFNGKSLAS